MVGSYSFLSLQYGSSGLLVSLQALVLGFVVWEAWLNCIVTALKGKKNTQVDKIRALFL